MLSLRVFEAGLALVAAPEKVSEKYFRKMRPSTRCLYSAAYTLARSLSAIRPDGLFDAVEHGLVLLVSVDRQRLARSALILLGVLGFAAQASSHRGLG